MAARPHGTKGSESVKKQHVYPGLGRPLRINDSLSNYPNGATHDDGTQSELIYVRELAMMNVMDRLTDKAGWEKKVFDDVIVGKWKKEALAIPDVEFFKLASYGKLRWGGSNDENGGSEDKTVGIMNERTFEYCVEELRGKAKWFEKSHVVSTLDACASIAKSDTIVPEDLHQALREGFRQLQVDQTSSPDWHPDSNDMVQDLVHPSMYPLVYGRTRVFQEECVGLEDAVKVWAGKGTVIPKEVVDTSGGTSDVSSTHWSNTYQWLPVNVAFQDDGSVKSTSYINNIHPIKNKDIYDTIERLIEKSLPMWDQCLALGGDPDAPGRLATRIPEPEDADDDNHANWVPDDPIQCADIEVDEDDLVEEGWDEEYCEPSELPEYKWKVVRQPRHPEVPDFEQVEYAPVEGRRLIETFKSSGLQIIVKMASIELTPEKPDFPAGGWHIEGQLNERICATALYYLDSENVTASNLSFRMRTNEYTSESPGFQVGQNSFSWLETVYGTDFGMDAPCLQNYGNVETRQGRLLAFPNVFQHRVSPFKLVDPTKPGHRRFIALWLVDPMCRIISTANVPPQQMSWYLDSLLGDVPESRKEALSKLPAELVTLLQEKGTSAVVPEADTVPAENAKLPEELMDMVREHFDADGHAMPMGVEEAKEHRLALMQERGAFQRSTEQEWQESSYNFCEH